MKALSSWISVQFQQVFFCWHSIAPWPCLFILKSHVNLAESLQSPCRSWNDLTLQVTAGFTGKVSKLIRLHPVRWRTVPSPFRTSQPPARCSHPSSVTPTPPQYGVEKLWMISTQSIWDPSLPGSESVQSTFTADLRSDHSTPVPGYLFTLIRVPEPSKAVVVDPKQCKKRRKSIPSCFYCYSYDSITFMSVRSLLYLKNGGCIPWSIQVPWNCAHIVELDIGLRRLIGGSVSPSKFAGNTEKYPSLRVLAGLSAVAHSRGFFCQD